MPNAIRAISLHQPYASGVALGLKHNETRHWPTKYRGPLAIHAAKRKPAFLHEHFGAIQKSTGLTSDHVFPLGAYVCTCVLVDCLAVEEYVSKHKLGAVEWLFGNYAAGRFVWMLDQIVQLPEPIPAIGQQGFWTWNR